MESNTIASFMSASQTSPKRDGADGVVEIGLLLPANRAAALLQLAKERHESVGQVLRKLIERELARPA
jgi:hypothetical protein